MTDVLTAFILIFIAEMGDKSQLVCMVLASRYRKLPVIGGAIIAFALLNLAAVTAGAAVSSSIPHSSVQIFAALLFSYFGIKTLLGDPEEDEDLSSTSNHGIFLTAFTMIFVAELGDKTQISVALLAASTNPTYIYIGATLALICTSILGAVCGQWLSQHIKTSTLNRIAGSLFLFFAAWLFGSVVIDLA